MLAGHNPTTDFSSCYEFCVVWHSGFKNVAPLLPATILLGVLLKQGLRLDHTLANLEIPTRRISRFCPFGFGLAVARSQVRRSDETAGEFVIVLRIDQPQHSFTVRT